VGVIETLSDGFDRLRKRAWLALVPVLLDLALWFAPRLSIDRLLRRWLPSAAEVTELGEPYVQLVEASRALLADPNARTNLAAVFSLRAISLPGLIGTVATPAPPLTIAQGAFEISNWQALLGWVVVLGLLGLFTGCAFLALLAQEARDEPLSLNHALQVGMRSWLRVTALILAGGFAVVVLGLGVILFAVVLSGFSPRVGGLVLSAFAVGVAWLSAYVGVVFFFFVRSVVLDDLGVFRSLWSALNVVHRNLLPVLGFVILFSVIQAGLMLVWGRLSTTLAGTLVAMVGNAYVSTGLVLASLVFYRDRFVAWQEAVQTPQSPPRTQSG
jgi:hypothetical protein